MDWADIGVGRGEIELRIKKIKVKRATLMDFLIIVTIDPPLSFNPDSTK
jgi:hypothetical protein